MQFIEVEFAGKRFRLDSVGGTDQVARQLSNGEYEPPLPMIMMATLLRIDGAFIDVGANTGIYSVLAGMIAVGRPIFAFEPLPAALEVLRRNMEVNQLTGSVTIHTKALSAHPGIATLHIPDPGHGLLETSASLEANFKGRQARGQSIEVEVTTLDAVGIPGPIGVIKVDIEGHEYSFLKGAKKTMMAERPFIFIEVLPIAQRQAIASLIREMEYMSFRLRPDIAIHDNGEVIFDHQAWNHALIPRERLGKFKEACDSCGLTVVRQFGLS